MNNSAQSRGLGGGALFLHALAKNWWALLLRGLVSILFGILAFSSPLIVGLSLVFLYGAYALVDGVFALYAAISGNGGAASRWWLAIVGIAGVLAGLYCFAVPVQAGLILVWLIGIWAIVSGVFEIMGAIRLRKEIDNEWLLILHGLLTVLFGILIVAMPVASAIAMIWVIGAYAIAAGVILSMLAFRLKRHVSHAH